MDNVDAIITTVLVLMYAGVHVFFQLAMKKMKYESKQLTKESREITKKYKQSLELEKSISKTIKDNRLKEKILTYKITSELSNKISEGTIDPLECQVMEVYDPVSDVTSKMYLN